MPVHDADAAVHRALRGRGGRGDRGGLPGHDRRRQGRPHQARARACSAMRRRSSGSRRSCIRWCRRPSAGCWRERAGARRKVAVLDIPLLFETGGDRRVDAVVVVSAPAGRAARARAGAPGMTAEKLDALLAQADAGRRKAPARRFRGGYLAGIRRCARPGAMRFLPPSLRCRSGGGDSRRLQENGTSMMREIVLDTETTGLDPVAGPSAWSRSAASKLVNRFPTGKTFHRYLNPERDVPPEAFAVHGLSVEFLRDKPLFADDRRRA